MSGMYERMANSAPPRENTGKTWSKRFYVKKPGIAQVRFLVDLNSDDVLVIKTHRKWFDKKSDHFDARTMVTKPCIKEIQGEDAYCAYCAGEYGPEVQGTIEFYTSSLYVRNLDKVKYPNSDGWLKYMYEPYYGSFYYEVIQMAQKKGVVTNRDYTLEHVLNEKSGKYERLVVPEDKEDFDVEDIVPYTHDELIQFLVEDFWPELLQPEVQEEDDEEAEEIDEETLARMQKNAPKRVQKQEDDEEETPPAQPDKSKLRLDQSDRDMFRNRKPQVAGSRR